MRSGSSVPERAAGAPGAAARRADVDRLVAYHGEVSAAMTAARTALESALIPVMPYILVSAVECWYRHPDMVRAIDAAMPAEAIGRGARRPGCRVNAVHLWSQANIYLTGRKLLAGLHPLGVVPDFDDDPEPTFAVLDFWRRAAAAYRGDDGTLQAWDAGGSNTPYDAAVVSTLVAGAEPVDGDASRARVTRFLATLYAYLFLLYFDTRVGTADTGPYSLAGGRTLLVRDFYWLAESEFPWSYVARDVPYRNLTAAVILGPGVTLRCDDWGTSHTDPADFAPFIEAFGLFTTDTGDGSLAPVPLAQLDDLVAVVRSAQSAHYRHVAAMSRREKIDAGAYVYFSFLKPFADEAGIGRELDWSVPRASAGDLYDLIESVDWSTMLTGDTDTAFYPPLAPEADGGTVA